MSDLLSNGMKFELLSNNTILIIQEVLKNQRLLKLINYASTYPLEESDIAKPDNLVTTKIFPTPFFADVQEVESVQLRVFFEMGEIQNGKILGSILVFQIIIPNSWWLIKIDDYDLALRPYLIMAELVNQFEKKSISTVGVLRFSRFRYSYVNEQVTAYELYSDMMSL